MDRLDAVVIGAGVVGLAIARELVLAGRDVVILEAEGAIGMHTSSRNSEVIHAGIHYPPDSLKARLCVAGNRALYAYCAEHDVAFSRVGKLIVASRDDQVPSLQAIRNQAEANGVMDLTWLDAREIAALEPCVVAVHGLFCPSTGIVDSHGLMTALRSEAERGGAQLMFRTPVLGGSVARRGIELRVGGTDPTTVVCRTVINAAGLRAQRVARSILGVRAAAVPAEYYAKGHYFVLAGRSPFSHLVYPAPVPGGLGVHVTLDLGGQARFGPDVSWVDDVDYAFDDTRATAFYQAIRSYYPGLPDDSLAPGYTGIRPKLGPPGAPAQDFVIQGQREHGVPGLLNLFGIESPGLTAALAIARHVLDASP